MTAQVPDCVWHNCTNYFITGVSGAGLVQDFVELDHEPLGSAWWRGWRATYRITDDALELTTITLGRPRSGLAHAVLLGSMPTFTGSDGQATYDNLGILPFTGTLTVEAQNQLPFVKLLTFEAGRLVLEETQWLHTPRLSGYGCIDMPQRPRLPPDAPWWARFKHFLGF